MPTRKHGQAVILIAGWYGRFGNRLRTFAHVIAAAIDVDCRVLNPCLDAADAVRTSIWHVIRSVGFQRSRARSLEHPP